MTDPAVHIAWAAGEAIVEHFSFAMDNLAALDFMVRFNFAANENVGNRLREIRLLTPAQWAEQQQTYEDNEERAAVMRLFAAFEGLIRRDGLWRGSTPNALHHVHFRRLTSTVAHGTRFRVRHVPFNRWLKCWTIVARLQNCLKLDANISMLNSIYTTDRNPLMHCDRNQCPPLARINSQICSTIQSILNCTSDFSCYL